MTNSIVTNTSEYAANKDKFLDFLALMIQKYQVKKTKKKK